MRFLSPKVALYLYKYLPYNHLWDTAMSGLVLLVATWNYQISYKNKYAGLLVFHLLPLLNPCLIIETQPAEVFSVCVNFVNVNLNWLNWFHFLILERGLLIVLIDCKNFLSPFLDVTRMPMSTIFFLGELDPGILCLENAFL